MLAQHRAIIEAALQLQEFQHPANLPLRHLVLEGETSFRDHFTGAAAARLLAEMKTRVPGDILGDLVRANGLRELIEDSDVSVEVAQELQTIVAQHFAGLPDSTAFRARSSSSVEDIEGFSGAGLYDSNTFYLHPDLAPAEDKKKHLLRALKKTWASYWSAEAFEERRRAGIDHLAGNMAILIHPRFDDPLERANAVATFSRRRIDGVTHDLLEVNVQAGAVSVTNPDGSALPEVDQVSLGSNMLTPLIGRIQSSTLAGANKAIWSDAQLLDIFRKVCSSLS